MSENVDLPRHVEVTLFQLLSLSHWCDRAYAGEVETCPREFSRNVAGVMINIRRSLPKDVLAKWDKTSEQIKSNYRAEKEREHPAFQYCDIYNAGEALERG